MQLTEKIFLIIGGDQRQIFLFNSLKEKGYKTEIIFNNNNTDKLSQLKEILKADVIILPIPTSQDQIHLFAPNFCEKIKLEEITKLISPNAILFTGGENKLFTACKTKRTINLLADESMTLKNAMATAEAALSIIINNTNATVFDTKILILGYGRIAKVLANYLESLHSKVTVCARKPVARTSAYLDGHTTIGFDCLDEDIGKYNIIVNTVPYLILDQNKLQKIDSNALLLDLASKPGGIDFKAANEMNLKSIHALSLPGKYSPKSSAEYIESAIFNTIL